MHHPMALVRECVLVGERALGQHLSALSLPALFGTNAAADPNDLNDVAKAALALDIPLELSEEGDASAAELAAAFATTAFTAALAATAAARVAGISRIGRLRGVVIGIRPRHLRAHRLQVGVEPRPELRRLFRHAARQVPRLAGILLQREQTRLLRLVIADELVAAEQDSRGGTAVTEIVVRKMENQLLPRAPHRPAPGGIAQHRD